MPFCICDADAKAAKAQSKNIDAQLKAAAKRESDVFNLLLLGTGSAGKSTLVKVWRCVYDGGFSDTERANFRDVVHSNILQATKTLVHACATLGIAVSGTPQLFAYADTVLTLPPMTPITPELAAMISALWRSDAVQAARRAPDSLLPDSTPFFMERLTEICKPDYVPSQQDVLRARVRTTGIIENHFSVDGYDFRIIDVGGQRNERRKWIHVFDGVDCLLFVVALSDFDQVAPDSPTQNRLQEALALFAEVVNSRWFAGVSVILLLNKVDLFSQKIQSGCDLRHCFPEYSGGPDVERAKDFIARQFLATNRSPPYARSIFSRFTTSTDPTAMRTILDDLRDIILTTNLASIGIG